MYNTTLKAKFEGKPSPYPVILPDSPRFTIVDVDKAYCKASHKRAADLMNKGLFEAFADIPNDPGSDLYSQAPSCMGILNGPNHIFELANPCDGVRPMVQLPMHYEEKRSTSLL